MKWLTQKLATRVVGNLLLAVLAADTVLPQEVKTPLHDLVVGLLRLYGS